MALTANLLWFIRVSGLETNGGGFDPSISGAGTNYADQDAPQLSITDLTSTNSTTATSILSAFTSAMVGNVLRIASGTGATTGYYTITTYVDASTVTLDRVSGTYTVGVAKVGGAHATLRNMSNGGSGLPTPAVASPLAAGHTVYMRSAGSSVDPSIAGTPDYDYSAGYYTFPLGNLTTGRIRVIGLGVSESIPAIGVIPAYRPLIKTAGNLLAHVSDYVDFYNFKSFSAVTTYATWGLNNGIQAITSHCIHDLNGLAVNGFGTAAGSVSIGMTIDSCWVKNTGTATASGSQFALSVGGYGFTVKDCLITDCRAGGISDATGFSTIFGNVVANAKGDAFYRGSSAATYISTMFNNTAYNPSGHGFSFTLEALGHTFIHNNTASKIPSGKYAYSVTSGTAAANDRVKRFFDYNNAYLDGGAGGLYNLLTAGPHDTNLDPQFVDPTSATWDFSIGTNLKAKGIGAVPFT